MELDVVPEPDADEHAALVAALEGVRDDEISPPARSAWWREGLRESLAAEP